MLAAAGSLAIGELADEVAGSRRYSTIPPFTEGELAGLLTAARAAEPDETGRWALTAPTQPRAGWAAPIDGAAGRELDKAALLTLLERLGYARSGLNPLIGSHPLLERTGRGRYRIVGSPAPPTDPPPAFPDRPQRRMMAGRVAAGDPPQRDGENLMAVSVNLAKALDKAYENSWLEEILAAPPSALSGLTEADDKALTDNLGIKTIRDLGSNKYFATAGVLVALGTHTG